MSEIADLSIQALSAEIRAHRLSPVEAVEACLRRIEDRDGELNSFLTICDESALAEARILADELTAGRWRGPLHGVPIALKDLFDTRGVRTTAASPIFTDRVPDGDATVVRFLRNAGAVILGKLNMHEFAFGSTSENPHFGDVRNPADPARVSGGSSGGSAAAVAAGLCFASLGSDTGGSIRVPASLCGIVGVKPTYGRVSRSGVVPLAWSLDHVGPMARTVADAATVLEAIAGHDPNDATTARRPVPFYAGALEPGVRGLRIGIPTVHFWEPLDPAVRRCAEDAVAHLRDAGVEVRQVYVPGTEIAAAAQAITIHAEAGDYHRATLQSHASQYGRDVRVRLLQGLFVTAADYLNAQRARARVRRDLFHCLNDIDALVTPTVPIPAPLLGCSETIMEGELYATRPLLVRNTGLFNLTGLPAVSVPCGNADGLPVGLQIAGRPWEEAVLLRLAAAVESATGNLPERGRPARIPIDQPGSQ